MPLLIRLIFLLITIIAVSACTSKLTTEEADEGSYVVTDFTEKTELFVEFSKLIKNKDTKFVTHLTRLSDYKPIMNGKVTVILSGGKNPIEKFSVNKISSPGIFKPIINSKYSGKRTLIIVFDAGSYEVTHQLGTYEISEDEVSSKKIEIESTSEEGLITYLKEQQWKFDFGISTVKKREVRSTITATATLRAPPQGDVRITATSTGRLNATKEGFPYVGMKVKKGQILGEIIPDLGTSVDIASLELELHKKTSKKKQAHLERLRLEKLYQQKVIAKKRLIEAQNKEDIANAEYQTIARRIQQQKSGDSNSNSQTSGVILRARITGTIAHVHATSGSYLKLGQEVFHIVNTNKLWLDIKIPEHDIGKLTNPVGAWFAIDGFKQSFNTLKLGGKIISIGSSVNTTTRTLPLLIEFNNPNQSLKVDMFADTHVITSVKNDAVTVPVSAVIDDNGTSVVYVQRDGEHFERREIKPGIRDDQYVQVLVGLKPGEYIVSKGGYLVRLASTSSTKVGHGHAH